MITWRSLFTVEAPYDHRSAYSVMFAICHRHRDVKPWHGNPTAFDLSSLTRQVVPPSELFPEVFHELERFKVFMVQVWLAKEEKDKIVPLARFLLLRHLDVGIAVRDEVDLDAALVGLLKLLGPALQVLVRSWHKVVSSQHGHGACGRVQRRCFRQHDPGPARRRPTNGFEYLPST